MDYTEMIPLTDTSRLVISSDDPDPEFPGHDAYVVELQHAVTWVRVNEDGMTVDFEFTHTHWETTESIGSCFLTDTYTAPVIAQEHWELTPEETAAVAALIESTP